MEFIGDLERLFATSLYPLRLPIAVAIAILAAVVARRAYRQRWDVSARRHPRRTAAIVVPVLALGLPLTWYLASPLFFKVELNEAAPVVALGQADASATAGASATADGQAGAQPSKAPTATLDATASAPAASAAASAAPESAAPPAPVPAQLSGQFTGADDFHFGKGTAILIETSPGSHVVRFEDFSVRNGPDLYVYLSPDAAGYADGAIELGRLKATDGNFNMDVPAGSDVSSAKSVVIWCKQFAVQFAVAPLG